MFWSSEEELMKWKKHRKARRVFLRKFATFAKTCDVDTVVVDDTPPRIVCYLLFRQQPDYSISYEESLLIRAIGVNVYMIVANSSFATFQTDLTLPQFGIFLITNIGNDSYDLAEELVKASWLDVKEWIEEKRIESRIREER